MDEGSGNSSGINQGESGESTQIEAEIVSNSREPTSTIQLKERYDAAQGVLRERYELLRRGVEGGAAWQPPSGCKKEALSKLLGSMEIGPAKPPPTTQLRSLWITATFPIADCVYLPRRCKEKSDMVAILGWNGSLHTHLLDDLGNQTDWKHQKILNLDKSRFTLSSSGGLYSIPFEDYVLRKLGIDSSLYGEGEPEHLLLCTVAPEFEKSANQAKQTKNQEPQEKKMIKGRYAHYVHIYSVYQNGSITKMKKKVQLENVDGDEIEYPEKSPRPKPSSVLRGITVILSSSDGDSTGNKRDGLYTVDYKMSRVWKHTFTGKPENFTDVHHPMDGRSKLNPEYITACEGHLFLTVQGKLMDYNLTECEPKPEPFDVLEEQDGSRCVSNVAHVSVEKGRLFVTRTHSDLLLVCNEADGARKESRVVEGSREFIEKNRTNVGRAEWCVFKVLLAKEGVHLAVYVSLGNSEDCKN